MQKPQMPYTPPPGLCRQTLESRFPPTPLKHSVYKLFQVIRRIKIYPNPELLCSESIYNFSSPLAGGKSGFQGGKPAGKRSPQGSGQVLVSWPLSTSARWGHRGGRRSGIGDEFLEPAAIDPLCGAALGHSYFAGPDSATGQRPHLEYPRAR